MKENKVVNEFNHFFSSIVTKLETKILKTESQYHESLRNPNEKTFFLTPTTAEEVEDLFKLLNDRKSIGIFSIPTKFSKYSKYCRSLLLN